MSTKDAVGEPARSQVPTATSVLQGVLAQSLTTIARPIRGFRKSYLPLITVYFAYGALGLIDVTRDMWIKEELRLSPSELAAIGVEMKAIRRCPDVAAT